MIPKKLHQIYWDFTNRAENMKYKWLKNTARWKKLNKQFEYTEWDDKLLFPMIKSLISPEEYKIFLTLPNIVQVDFGRLALLYKVGGFYIDRDIVPHKSLTCLTENDKIRLVFFVETLIENNETIYVGNAAIGCEPLHPIMKKIFKEATRKLHELHELSEKLEWNDYDVFYRFGTHFLSNWLHVEFGPLIYVNIDELEDFTRNIDKDGVYNARYPDDVLFLPPEAMLGCSLYEKGYLFGSHQTHGTWKLKFKNECVTNNFFLDDVTTTTT